MSETIPAIDVSDEQAVRDYFARLERYSPELIEAMKTLNISYQQYLTAMRAMNQHSSLSTDSAQLTL